MQARSGPWAIVCQPMYYIPKMIIGPGDKDDLKKLTYKKKKKLTYSLMGRN